MHGSEAKPLDRSELASAIMEARVAQLESDISTLKIQVASQLKNIDQQKKDLVDQLNGELVQHKLMMNEIVEGAKSEFKGIQVGMQIMYDEVSGGFKDILQRVMDLEQNRNNGSGQKGYIPRKAMMPKEFSGQGEDWRAWQDDVLDYLDSVTPGMREFLKEAELETDAVTEQWTRDRAAKYGPKVVGDTVQVWGALKALTVGEARKVIVSIKTEDGYRAWQKLHMHFGPSLASRQGLVLADPSGMVAKPAKTPNDTRTLVMELERRIKVAEDVTGELISENHTKSILVGILDPLTRQHTAMHHGVTATFEQLKRVILEFINNVSRQEDAMQVGRVSGANADESEDVPQIDPFDGGFVNAVGKGTQCYHCHGYGHFARECPTKGRGKGMDKGWHDKSKGGKGYSSYGAIRTDKGGKSKGKGPIGGCWACGGAHYQSECPKGKGKGKGKVGLRPVTEVAGTAGGPMRSGARRFVLCRVSFSRSRPRSARATRRLTTRRTSSRPPQTRQNPRDNSFGMHRSSGRSWAREGAQGQSPEARPRFGTLRRSSGARSGRIASGRWRSRARSTRRPSARTHGAKKW